MLDLAFRTSADERSSQPSGGGSGQRVAGQWVSVSLANIGHTAEVMPMFEYCMAFGLYLANVSGRWTEGSFCYGIYPPNSTGSKVSLGWHLWAVAVQPERDCVCRVSGPATKKNYINGGNQYFICQLLLKMHCFQDNHLTLCSAAKKNSGKKKKVLLGESVIRNFIISFLAEKGSPTYYED